MGTSILAYIILGSMTWFLGNLIYLLRYFNEQPIRSMRDFVQARFNWYLQCRPAQIVMGINYIAYSLGIWLVPGLVNTEVTGEVPVYAAFLLGFIPIFVHLFANSGMWIISRAFNALYYYKNRMEGFKGINLTLNFFIGGYIWLVAFVAIQLANGKLTETFIIDFYMMVFSWKHFLLMFLIHCCTMLMLRKWDYAPPFFEALYQAVYPDAQEDESAADLQEIQAETQSDNFKMNLSELIYAVSDGNYTDIYVLYEGGVKCLSKRLSVKNLEEQLMEDQRFFRSHKSYLVNMEYINSYTGNSHGLKLLLEQSGLPEIPVSRAKVKDFKNRYESYKEKQSLVAIWEDELTASSVD